jgi:CHAT domain-containing protein
LGQVSRDYKDHLRVRTANLDDLRAALPAEAALIEFRQFHPFDFRSGTWGEPRLAALLLMGFEEPVIADLGPLADLRASAEALLAPSASVPADAAAAVLYRRLFAPFESRLAAAKTIYLAPDGFLHLIPYSRLKLADGRHGEERQELHLLQTGRDLLRPDPDKPGRGLLALGGIDFGTGATAAGQPDNVFSAADGGQDLSDAIARAATSFGRFGPLPASGEEAIRIKEWYQRYRKDEPAEVWPGAEASETRLKALKAPPRVLHLATHGFYLPGDAPEPMLLSGIALAGANRALADKDDDGILFALEAQGLNLDGSELVVLSACDTAQGSLDYSEGVYGLVRALRTAGARNVLVTLWPLNDGEARDFMIAFYKRWLAQSGRSDPAKALRETRLAYITHTNPTLRDPRVWAPYVLVE